LSKPRDVLSEIPRSRFDPHGFYNPVGDTSGHSNVLHSYVLNEDVRAWDADFFNISANEAAAIDPQQRLLMETVFEALETGGQRIGDLRGSDTAVYVGLMGEEYSSIQGRELDMMPTVSLSKDFPVLPKATFVDVDSSNSIMRLERPVPSCQTASPTFSTGMEPV